MAVEAIFHNKILSDRFLIIWSLTSWLSHTEVSNCFSINPLVVQDFISILFTDTLKFQKFSRKNPAFLSDYSRQSKISVLGNVSRGFTEDHAFLCWSKILDKHNGSFPMNKQELLLLCLKIVLIGYILSWLYIYGGFGQKYDIGFGHFSLEIFITW